jgi:hypothetical protein
MTMRRALLVCGLIALVLPLVALADSPPTITVPADMTVEAQNFSGATVTYTASAVDDRGQAVPVSCTPPSGAIFGFGTTTVTCTARAHGESATKRFTVTVVDTRPPTIVVPPAQRLTTRARQGKAVTYAASANDVVDGPVTPTCSPASGSSFGVGTTTVTCSAVDRRGNATNASFTVTIVLAKKRAKKNLVLFAPSAGARVTAPPTLRWKKPAKARFFNVQVYRRGHKVLSVWPTRSRFRLHRSWTFAGRRYSLKPGSYTWLVWPAFGSQAEPRYGKLLGQSTFLYAR